MIALAGLMANESRSSEDHPSADSTLDPLALRSPHFPPKAKRIIFLFMSGGPSHVDTFDPKNRLSKDNGKPLPFEMPKLVRTNTGNMLPSPFKLHKHGQAGIHGN